MSKVLFSNGGGLIIRFKLLKWWAQSFLPGVPRVVAGFRDHDGVVVAVEDFPVSKMSHLAKVHFFGSDTIQQDEIQINLAPFAPSDAPPDRANPTAGNQPSA